MKTADDVRRAKTLLATLDDARDYRESLELPDKEGEDYPLAAFDVALTQENRDGRQSITFEGQLEVPRSLAIEWLQWLEARARGELAKIGVKV